MFFHLRLASSCVWSCRRPLQHNFSSTSTARTSLAPDPPFETYTPVNATADPEEGAGLAEKASEEDVPPKDEQAGQDNTKIETYNEFMAAIGNRFKNADKPRQWLGDNVVEFVLYPLSYHTLKQLTWYLSTAFPHEPFFQTPTTGIRWFEDSHLWGVYARPYKEQRQILISTISPEPETGRRNSSTERHGTGVD